MTSFVDLHSFDLIDAIFEARSHTSQTDLKECVSGCKSNDLNGYVKIYDP